MGIGSGSANRRLMVSNAMGFAFQAEHLLLGAPIYAVNCPPLCRSLMPTPFIWKLLSMISSVRNSSDEPVASCMKRKPYRMRALLASLGRQILSQPRMHVEPHRWLNGTLVPPTRLLRSAIVLKPSSKSTVCCFSPIAGGSLARKDGANRILRKPRPPGRRSRSWVGVGVLTWVSIMLE